MFGREVYVTNLLHLQLQKLFLPHHTMNKNEVEILWIIFLLPFNKLHQFNDYENLQKLYLGQQEN